MFSGDSVWENIMQLTVRAIWITSHKHEHHEMSSVKELLDLLATAASIAANDDRVRRLEEINNRFPKLDVVREAQLSSSLCTQHKDNKVMVRGADYRTAARFTSNTLFSAYRGVFQECDGEISAQFFQRPKILNGRDDVSLRDSGCCTTENQSQASTHVHIECWCERACACVFRENKREYEGVRRVYV